MDAVNVVLFRHSPRPVELWHLNDRDAIILSHESSSSRYKSVPPVDQSMVRFLVDFEVPTLFRAIREIAREHTIRSVSTLAEEDIATAGLLEEFFVTGVSEYAVGTLFKDKLFMRSALEGKIPQPDFRGLEEFTGTREQLLTEGFDIVKPRRSAGAQGVYLLDDIDDDEFAALPLCDYIAESFIQTPRMVTVDGFLEDRKKQLALMKNRASGDLKQQLGLEYNRTCNWLEMLDKMGVTKVSELWERLREEDLALTFS